jgi:hypothetical protein
MPKPMDEMPDETYAECKALQELIPLYASERVRALQKRESESKLEAEISELLEVHLLHCEECRKELASWEQLFGALSGSSAYRDRMDSTLAEFLKRAGGGNA